MTPTVRPVSHPIDATVEQRTYWWCSECKTRVAGPWHDQDCPNRRAAS